MEIRNYLRRYMIPQYRNPDGTYSAPCPLCGRLSLLADRMGSCIEQSCCCPLFTVAEPLRDAVHEREAVAAACPAPALYPSPALSLSTSLPAQAASGSEDEGPQMVQVAAFLREVGSPPPMLVEGLIPDYSLIALTGKPKFGKSLCALDLLDAVCQGQPVFGTYPVNRPGPVIYLGMEDGKFEIANRLRQRGIGQEDGRPFHLCATRFTLGRSEGIAALERMVAPLNPVLILIDTAREGLGIGDWYNPVEVADKLRPLRDFAREHCTILLIAHNRKAEGEWGDEISGSNAFTSSIDGWLSCYKKEILPNGNLRLFVRKEGRAGMRGEFAVEMDTQTLRFTALTQEQLAESKRPAQNDLQLERYRSVLHLMAENNDRTTAIQVAERLEIDIRSAQRILKEMVSQQGIEDSGERTGENHRVVVYRLAEEDATNDSATES